MFAEQLAIWGLLLVPECWMMTVVGLRIVSLRRSLARVTVVGVVMATAIALSKAWLPEGYHVFAIVVVYCVLFMSVLRVSSKATLIACLAAFSLLNLGQLLVALPILKLVGLSVDDTLASLPLRIAFGWLSDILLVAGTIYSVISRSRAASFGESSRSQNTDANR